MGKLVGKKVPCDFLLDASIVDGEVLNRFVAKVRVVLALLLVDAGRQGVHGLLAGCLVLMVDRKDEVFNINDLQIPLHFGSYVLLELTFCRKGCP